jgi:hypothetical protein
MSSEVKLNFKKVPMPSGGVSETLETLTHAQTCHKRNTHLHNVCIEMLRNGQHRAYTELFNLVENRRKARIAAGPGSEMSLEIKLENENNYLDKLKENLCAAEENEMSKSYQNQYKNILELANYFQTEQVSWLSDHFYTLTLKIAGKVGLDSGRSLCEANEKCGLAAEARNELDQARQFLCAARKISRGRNNWKHEDGLTWNQINSKHYARIIIKLAQSLHNISDITLLLEEAVIAADESKIDLTISQVNYNYGCHLSKLSNGSDSEFVQKAHVVLEKALNSAININNCQLISKTAKELAVVAKINKDSSVLIDKAAEYLKLAVDKTTNDVASSIDALSEVALLYNAYGDYGEAKKSIDDAYLAVGHQGDPKREICTRITSGTVHGNAKFSQFRSILSKSTQDQESLKQLMNWKNTGQSNQIN